MSTYTRKIIAVRGDTQSGDSGGLLNPATLYPVVGIDEEGAKVIETYEEAHLNPVQRQLWKWSEEDRANVQALAEKDDVVFLEMGDMTQGARFTDDLKETSLSRQTITSYYNSLPWLGMENVFTMRAVKGTGVHVWGEGQHRDHPDHAPAAAVSPERCQDILPLPFVGGSFFDRCCPPWSRSRDPKLDPRQRLRIVREVHPHG